MRLNTHVFDDHVLAVLEPTLKSCGWFSVMGTTSLLLCMPDRQQRLRVLPHGWAFPAAQAGCVREALRAASAWVRRQWDPDFTCEAPFGIDRRLAVRKHGDLVAITSPQFPDYTEPVGQIEINYIEVPALRSAIQRQAREWARSVTAMQGATPWERT